MPGPVAARPASTDDVAVEVSGRFSLFHRTVLYGHALAELVPILSWCVRFEMRCECELGGRQRTLVVSSGDPILPSTEPRRYDSRLEERFASDFRRAAPEFDVIREPEPVQAAGTLIFSDFALEHRQDRSRRWLLEIVGFWTADYLANKLARLRAARIPNLAPRAACA